MMTVLMLETRDNALMLSVGEEEGQGKLRVRVARFEV